MTNIIESLKTLIGSLTDEEPMPPLHVGEVMHIWTLLTMYSEGQMFYEVAQNTTTDPELLHAVKEAQRTSLDESNSIRDFLVKEGVPLPSSYDPKPDSNPAEVPLGAKLSDEEIANLIVGKVSGCIALCGAALAQSLRNDVGMLFLKQLGILLNFGTPYKALMRKRGWLKNPPFYYPPGGEPAPQR